MGLFTYGWSLLLTVNWLGLFHLRLLTVEVGSVFVIYGSPRPEIGFGLFLPTVPSP